MRRIPKISVLTIGVYSFALFIFAGYFKAADSLRFVPVDLTLVFWSLCAGCCVYVLWCRRRWPRGVLPLLAVFLLMAQGLHWPEGIAAYEVQKEMRLYSLTALSAFAPFILLEGENERRSFLLAAALLGVVMAIVGSIDLIVAGTAHRLIVFNANPILLARASGFAVLVLCLLYWQRIVGLWIFLPLSVVTVMALLASGSRGPLVALLVTLVAALAVSARRGRSTLRRRGTVLLSVTGLIVVVLQFEWVSERVVGRLLRLFTGDWGHSEALRLSIWSRTSDLVAASPHGIGWSRFSEWIQIHNDGKLLLYPHNIFLEIAAEAGWVAVVGFSALVIWTLFASCRAAGRANSAGKAPRIDDLLVFSALLYWLGCAFFSGDVNDNRPFWAVLGVTLAALAARSTERPSDRAHSVLHVSSAHRVSDNRIGWKEAVALCAAGYDVAVLGLERAAGSNLPNGPRFIEYDAPASRARRFVVRLPWLLGYCLRHRYDLYHLHDPDLVLVGFILKLAGRRVVYDAHESYSNVILDRQWIPHYLRTPLSLLWRALERGFARCSDLTIAAHLPVERQFNGARTTTVHNYPAMCDLEVTSAPAMAERPWRILYHGDLTEQRGLLTMVAAIGAVELEPAPELLLAGSLSPAMRQRLDSLPGMERVRLLGWLDKESLAQELSQVRLGLVLLHPTHNYRIIRPNKLFEYMAVGLPVIASDFPHWREVVSPAKCGLLVDPLDSRAIARAIEYLLTHPDEAAEMGARGREAIAAHYNWETERSRLIASYSEILTAAEGSALGKRTASRV